MKLRIIAMCFVFCDTYSSTELEKIFSSIYHNHLWSSTESVSGSGSTLYQTQNLRKILPKLIKDLKIKTLLDVPCGDFNWMKKIDLSSLDLYIGLDIVKGLIQENKKRYEKNNIIFFHSDVSKDDLPHVDLIMCRDLFLHLKFEDIFKILKNFKKNNARYILLSTYAKAKHNVDKEKVDATYRPVNLERAPFNFPKPLLLIEDYKQYGKYMGLWEITNIPCN